jgi:phage/plasmid primase-like uncharacterized protein
MKTRKVERCPVCGKKHRIFELQDIEHEDGKVEKVWVLVEGCELDICRKAAKSLNKILGGVRR